MKVSVQHRNPTGPGLVLDIIGKGGKSLNRSGLVAGGTQDVSLKAGQRLRIEPGRERATVALAVKHGGRFGDAALTMEHKKLASEQPGNPQSPTDWKWDLVRTDPLEPEKAAYTELRDGEMLEISGVPEAATVKADDPAAEAGSGAAGDPQPQPEPQDAGPQPEPAA